MKDGWPLRATLNGMEVAMIPLKEKRGWSEGVIVTDSGDLLACPGMTLQELQQSPLGTSAELSGNAEYPRATLKLVQIGGYECGVGLVFHSEKLVDVTIVLADETKTWYGLETSYIAAPEPEVRFLKQWLARETGQESGCTFSWGRITALYDSRGGFSSITFVYRE